MVIVDALRSPFCNRGVADVYAIPTNVSSPTIHFIV
jgi:hypothetical protein